MQLIDVVMNWLRFRTFFVRCPPDDGGQSLVFFLPSEPIVRLFHEKAAKATACSRKVAI